MQLVEKLHVTYMLPIEDWVHKLSCICNIQHRAEVKNNKIKQIQTFMVVIVMHQCQLL